MAEAPRRADGLIRPRLPGLHVVVSELAIAAEGTRQLETAFVQRLGEVDDFAGHVALEVWKDDRRPGRYLQVTWWESPLAFRAYMRSDAHRRSHARIPADPAPTGVRVDRFSLVST